MSQTIKSIFVMMSVLLASNSMACDIDGKTGFMPTNDMYIGLEESVGNGMTEATFNNVIDRAFEVYEPIVKENGGNLVMVRKWTDGTVNAYANQTGSTWNVHMFGGLARHESVSADGFALVLCHELGHHLAGAPKIKRFFFPSWASNEGQSDYWATAKCFRRIYGADDNISIVANLEVDAEVTKKCEANWNNSEDIALCIRQSVASKGLATLLNSGKPVDFTKPDTSVVSKTNDKHPAGQCRLDTYFNGALCTKDYSEDVSKTNAKTGVCNRSENFDDGVRPLCWYKPASI